MRIPLLLAALSEDGSANLGPPALAQLPARLPLPHLLEPAAAQLQLPASATPASSTGLSGLPSSPAPGGGSLRERPARGRRAGAPGRRLERGHARRRGRPRPQVEPSGRARPSTPPSTPTSRRSRRTSPRSPSTTASPSSTRRSARSSWRASTSSTPRSRPSTPAPSPRRAGAAASPASSAAPSYTLLAADDRGGGSVILPGPTGSALAPQDYRSVVGIGRRAPRRWDRRSWALLYTGREIDGGGYNRVVGPDFQWRPGRVRRRDRPGPVERHRDARPARAGRRVGRAKLSGHAPRCVLGPHSRAVGHLRALSGRRRRISRRRGLRAPGRLQARRR